jgi:HD-GYP domain-containing protein (c-di-GMP phosphodiesterase class II)
MPPAELLLGILDSIDCGVIATGPDPGTLHLNAWVRRLTGFSSPASLADLGAAGGDDWRSFIANLPGGTDTALRTFFLTAAGGNRVVVQATVRALIPFTPGDFTIYLATLIDLTRHEQAEHRLRDLNDRLAEISDTTIREALGLQDLNAELERKVEERTRDLRDANLAALRMLAIASEARDSDTGEHVRRIQHYVELLASELGLPARDVKRLGYASILHDVGKIHLPDRILLKPGPLTADERLEMQRHTVIGEKILAASAFFSAAAAVARSHHENWDGSGYPDGKLGDAIPVEARITHLADVFDALASPRVYKAAWPPDRVVAIIRADRGKQFDPAVVNAFDRLLARNAWTLVG